MCCLAEQILPAHDIYQVKRGRVNWADAMVCAEVVHLLVPAGYPEFLADEFDRIERVAEQGSVATQSSQSSFQIKGITREKAHLSTKLAPTWDPMASKRVRTPSSSSSSADAACVRDDVLPMLSR